MAQFHPEWLKARQRRWRLDDSNPWVRLDRQRSTRVFASRARRPASDREDASPRVPHRKVDPRDESEEAELAQRRREIARLRLDFELLKWELRARKALYPSHDQPRVPAGNPDGGQWTTEGVQGSPTRLAGDIPGIGHNRPPVEVPPTQPPSRRRLNELIRTLAKLAAPVALLIQSGATWLQEFRAEIESYRDPPKTLEELQQAAVGPSRPGYQKHHINEQTAARTDNFSESLIESPENLVSIPTRKHYEITEWYRQSNARFRNNRGESISPREYLRRATWEERRRLGLEALIEHGVLKP
jgi:hypothetical protein